MKAWVNVSDMLQGARRIQTRSERHVRAFKEAVKEGAYYIFFLSQSLVPVVTGELKGSGSITISETSDGIAFLIVYGAYYAIYVHEDLTKYHPNGQAKFLEAAFAQGMPLTLSMIHDRLKAA